LLTKLKKRVQSWLVIEAKFLHNLGLTPNHVSIVGIIFAIMAAIVYSNWIINPFLLLIAPILLLISGLFDSLDGVIARIYGKVTIFGGFFDSILDRYADSFVICGIIFGELTEMSWGFAALIGSLLVSYSRARAEASGIQMESIGLTERAERIIILVLISFLGYFWIEVFNWGMLLLAFLTNLTVVQRVIHFYKLCK
jgi:archaetidylinositol phosphate synthase